MGNRSVPSKACEPCRLKRRKCDLKQPTCSQCTRACVLCPGYKDPFSLYMRDETFATRCKAQETKRRESQPLPKAKKQGYCTTRTETSMVLMARTTKPNNEFATDILMELSYSSSLNIDLGEVALNNFFNNYAAHSVFDYLPNFYNSLRLLNPAIDLAVSVPALALLSQDLKHPPFLRLSYYKYAEVLETTQHALRDADLATCDGTLLSVLLLALFEALVLRGRQHPTSWNAHIQGAAALLEMRGMKQFDRPIGWHLFFHASNSIRTNCVIKAIPVPKSLGLPLRQKSPLESQNQLSLRIGRILDDFAHLRAYKNAMKTSKWIAKSRALDNEIGDLLSEMSQNTPFKTVKGLDTLGLMMPCCTFTDGADEYPSEKGLKRWNTLRMLRIFLDDLICVALSANNWDKTANPVAVDQYSEEKMLCLYQVTKSRAEQAISAILRSVPYSINSCDKPQFSAKSLICPLSAIAVSELASKSAKESAMNVLKFLGHTYGLTQATESVNMAVEFNDVEDWVFLSHFS